MNKTRFIQIRVTKNQYERINNNARAKGFLTVSAYIRDLALGKDAAFERKVNELYEEIVGKNKKDSKTSGQSNHINYETM